MNIPDTQHAVQLVGPGELRHVTDKPVNKPGPYEILVKVEAVGLCFSDLKLLKQFDQHARKSDIIGGLSADVLSNVQSYVPGSKPTVPGHEVVCRIVAVGEMVAKHTVGERCLVQTDYRQLPTANSNAAFGYNFEGGLQEYVILDERVIIDEHGERFLIPVGDEKSASAVALVEPWACVEDSYVNRERQSLLQGGRLAIVAEDLAKAELAPDVGSKVRKAVKPEEAATLDNEAWDDIIYFGADAQVIETLSDKLAARGMINIVLGGERIGRPVNIGVGRVHYGMTRWVGTAGDDPMESYAHVPATDEIREGDRILVVGAGGPMGQMHVIRNACLGVKGLSIVATDFDDARLDSLLHKVAPMAEANDVAVEMVNPQKKPIEGEFDYIALMAPVPALVAQAVGQARQNAIINIFAGIPAPTKHEIDLDAYIEKKCFMFGTSGSVIEDMKIVLRKVESGGLDTNTSIDAIAGMAGAAEGVAAVENRTLAGKIVVYPMLHDVGLIPLAELASHYPTVADKLDDGKWTHAAEQELLRVAGG